MSSNSKNDEEKSASFRKWNIHDYNRMIASMTSGFIQSLAGHPIDSIKVRMQTWEESVKPNFWRAVKDMYVKEGDCHKQYIHLFLSPSNIEIHLYF